MMYQNLTVVVVPLGVTDLSSPANGRQFGEGLNPCVLILPVCAQIKLLCA